MSEKIDSIGTPLQFQPQGPRDGRPAAQTPGTLVHVGERLTDEVSFHLFDYASEGLREAESATLEECLAIDEPDTPTWLNVCGLHDTAAIGQLLEAFAIHPLIQEDVLNTRHRLKVEDFGDYVFVAAKEILYSKETHQIQIRHLSLILTDSAVITFQERPSDVFAPIAERLRSGKGLLRQQGCDYLAWALLDALTDHYRIALDRIAAEVDAEEDLAETDARAISPARLHALKRQLDHFYRSIGPMREIAAGLGRMDSPLMNERTRIFWSDLHDHALHATEQAETLRETVASLRDLHLAALNRRMNEVMRVLTSFASIFMPLTFIAGVYGMNFKHMPELEWKWSYPVIWASFLITAAVLFALFRKRRWL